MRAFHYAAVCGLLSALACATLERTTSSAASGAVPVGVAAVDITPAEPIRLTGYGNRAVPSTVVGQRLSARALAFGEDRPAVLITADLIGVSQKMTDEVARRLAKAGVDRAQMAIAATHTHTAPSLAGILPGIFSTPLTRAEQAAIDRYTEQVVGRFEQAALAALADRRPARLAWTQGRAAFAANRRVLKDGKWVGFGVTPEGPVDPDVPVLSVHSLDGTLRAVLLNYACHATTLEARENFVHGDWPGTAAALIQQRHPGAVALVAIGTGADANPNPRGGGMRDVERHAREVADEVDRLLSGRQTAIRTPPEGRLQSVALGFEGTSHKAPYPVQSWTFGTDLVMVFLGGEVVADYGLRLKKEIDRSRLWVNAYANDVAFYVASRRMIPEGGYEVDRSMAYYGQPARLADATEDQIIGAVRQLVPPTFLRR